MLKTYDEEIAKLNKEFERIKVVKSDVLVDFQKLVKSNILKLSANF